MVVGHYCYCVSISVIFDGFFSLLWANEKGSSKSRWQNADEIVKFYALSVLFHALKLFYPSVKTQKFVSSWCIFQAIITLRHDAINFSNPPTSCQTLKFSLTTALKIHSKFVTKFINFNFFMFSLLSLMLGKWIYGVEEMSTVFSMFFLNMTHLTSTSHQQHEK